MSGVELAIPIIELTAAVFKLGNLLGDGLPDENIHEDARACESLIHQVHRDLQYAQVLETRLHNSILQHDEMGVWILKTIENTKKTAGKYKDYIPKEDDRHATWEAFVRKMRQERKWGEWENALRVCHSSLLATINAMHQLDISLRSDGCSRPLGD